MLPDLPQSTRGTTNGNLEDRNNDDSENIFILAFVAIFAALLQVKFQNKSESPFEAQYALMVAFLVTLLLYFLALLTKKKLVEAYERFGKIIKSCVHLIGILSIVLLLLMLVPILGLIILGLWLFCFVMVTSVLFARIIAPTGTGNTDTSTQV